MYYEDSTPECPSGSSIIDSRKPFFIVNNEDFPLLVEAGGSATLVYLYLSRVAGAKEVCFPTVNTVCAHTKLSLNTVKRSVTTLIELGLIKRVKRAGTSNLYVIGSSDFDNRSDQKLGELSDQKLVPKEDTTKKTVSTLSKSERRKGVPDDWLPTENGILYASDHGMPTHEITTQVERFILHHQSKKNVFANIDKAWMTWCLGYRPNGSANQNRTWSEKPVVEWEWSEEDKQKAIAAEEAYRLEHPDPVQ